MQSTSIPVDTPHAQHCSIHAWFAELAVRFGAGAPSAWAGRISACQHMSRLLDIRKAKLRQALQPAELHGRARDLVSLSHPGLDQHCSAGTSPSWTCRSSALGQQIAVSPQSHTAAPASPPSLQSTVTSITRITTATAVQWRSTKPLDLEKPFISAQQENATTKAKG